MNLFNEDNFLNIALNRIGDIVIVNILFFLCCLPVITIGPALTALYHCTLRFVKGNNPGTAKTFFKAFFQNFLQSFLVWIGILAFGVMLFLNIRFLNHMSSEAYSQVLLSLSYAVIVLLVIVALYVFPVIAAFSGTIKNHLKNAFLFAFMKFPFTLLIAVISLLPIYMTYQDLGLLPLYAICWAAFGFGLTAYLNSMMFYKMFKPYLEKE